VLVAAWLSGLQGSVGIATGATLTLVPIADAKVDASTPTTNYATWALRVDGSPVVRSYLKFDASAVSGPVQTATLRIWATSAQSVGFDVYAVADASWTETGLTAANQPSGSISASKLGSSGSVSADTWKTVDVTALLGAPGIYSIMLQTTNSQALALSSREDTAHPPQLVLSFGTAGATVPDAPSNVSAIAGDSQATVSWTAPAANGSPISGYAITGTPTGSASAPSGATSATVTGLTNGTSYTFTVTATNGVGPGPASAASNAVKPIGVTIVPNLRRTPYLTDVSPTTAMVNFATDSSAPLPTVSWGPASGDCTAPPSSVPAVWVTSFAGSRSGTTDYQFKAAIGGLEPDTSYCYRVEQNGTDLVGAAITFTTAPAPGSAAPFSFAVVGDWGGGTADEANVLTQIALGQPRFLMTVGDNVYPGGTQTDYGDLNGGNAFRPIYLPKLGSGTPIFPAIGNHGFTSFQPYLDNFPQDAITASSGGTYSGQAYCCAAGTSMTNTYASAWYAFTWGNARFYVLDGAWADGNGDYRGDFTDHWNGPVAGCTPCGQELTWLQGDLAANASVPLKFAFFHYPLHADGGHPSDPYLGGPNALEGLLANSGVDIVFNGHAHIYERNLPQIAGTAMVSYVSGGGGAALASVSSCSAFDAYAIGANSRCNAPLPTSNSQAFHYLKVTVDGNQVTVSPIDETGRSFDVQTYAFGPTPVDTTPPTAPTGLTATPLGSSRIDLSWAAATDDVGVVGYDVSRGGAFLTSVSGQTLAFSDTTVAASSTYTYTVRARDLAGNASPESVSASATTQGGASSVTVTPVADAFVDKSKPTSNFGNLTALRVDGSPVVRSYLRFNVQGGAGTITKATLRIYANSASTTGLGARSVTGAWAESTLTDNNAPALGSSNVGTSSNAVAGTWLTMDVTALVKGSGFVDIGVLTAGSTAISLASRESANAPQLVVQFSP
jgi:hypothetical protein